MSEISWIKLAADVFDNRKIKQIEVMPDGDALIVIWFKLLTLAGKVNDGGRVYFIEDVPYTDEMLAAAFGRPLNTIRLALNTFQRFRMIEVVDDIIYLPGWEKYQNVDGLARVREQTRNRVAAYRERHKLPKPAEDNGSNATCNVTVTHSNAIEIDIERDIEIYKEKDISNDISKKKSRFTPPSADEVREYIKEKRYVVDAEAFCAFYDSNGWKVGRNPMKDWRRALVTWDKCRRDSAPKTEQTSPPAYRRFTDDSY